MAVQEQLAKLFADVQVDGFLHARDLATGAEIGFNADDPVVSASTFKVPVLVELFRQGDAATIDLTEQVTVPVEKRAPGPTGLSVMKDPATLSWRDIAFWMIVVSDNAATDFICEKVGIENVNATMRELGLPGTQLEGDCRNIFATMAEDAGVSSPEDFPSPVPMELVQRLRAETPLQTNRSTPREMTRLFELIWTDMAASPDACEQMRDILLHQVWPHRLASGFPEDDIHTAGKTGTLVIVRNESGMVLYPDGARYAVAVFTRSHTVREKNPDADAVIGKAARTAVEALRSSSSSAE